MPPRLVIVANPAAGRGRGLRLAEAAARRLAERGFSVDVQRTGAPEDAARLAEQAAADGVAALVACGGDGTVGACAGALVGSSTPLGILPAGRGNDFAASLGLPPEWDRAAEVIAAGFERAVDLGVVNGRRFCTVAGIGFEARVLTLVRRRAFRPLGGTAYAVGAIAALGAYRPPRTRLTGDFGTREGRFLLVAVSNTGRYGGGMWIAPGASPDDGLLDCCLVRDARLLRLLRIFPAVFRGRHVHFREVEVLRTATLLVESEPAAGLVVDGELVEGTPARFQVERLAVRVLVARTRG